MKLYIGLAGPLLLFVYLPLVLIGLAVLFRKVKQWKTRAWAIPLYLILAYAIPLGDVTLHSWNMSKVCPKAGLHVYRTVVVDGFMPGGEYTVRERGYRFAESAQGRIDVKTGLFLVTRWEKTESGVQRLDGVPSKSEWELISTIATPDYKLGVSKTYEAIQNRFTKEVIAERKVFLAWRGWIDAWIGSVIDNSVGGCDGGSRMLRDSIEIILISSGGSK